MNKNEIEKLIKNAGLTKKEVIEAQGKPVEDNGVHNPIIWISSSDKMFRRLVETLRETRMEKVLLDEGILGYQVIRTDLIAPQTNPFRVETPSPRVMRLLEESFKISAAAMKEIAAYIYGSYDDMPYKILRLFHEGSEDSSREEILGDVKNRPLKSL